MNYPSINEYKEAILFAEDNFEQLKNLRPILDEEGNPVNVYGITVDTPALNYKVYCQQMHQYERAFVNSLPSIRHEQL